MAWNWQHPDWLAFKLDREVLVDIEGRFLSAAGEVAGVVRHLGRAVAEKAISQSLGRPAMMRLSTVILKRRKEHYRALERATKNLEVTEWLVRFPETCFLAARTALRQVELVLEKTKLVDTRSCRTAGAWPARQTCTCPAREGRAGPSGV